MQYGVKHRTGRRSRKWKPQLRADFGHTPSQSSETVASQTVQRSYLENSLPDIERLNAARWRLSRKLWAHLFRIYLDRWLRFDLVCLWSEQPIKWLSCTASVRLWQSAQMQSPLCSSHNYNLCLGVRARKIRNWQSESIWNQYGLLTWSRLF